VFNGAVLIRSVRLRALPLLSVVLLTGCGVAGAQFHPGVAAQVGDQTITTRHVDQVTDDYCKAVEKVSEEQPDQAGQPTPLRYLTHQFASALIVKAATEQLADEEGVKPTSDYKTTLTQLEPQLTKLSDQEKDSVREVIGARAYAQDVLTQIGDASLKKQGKTDATDSDKYAEGQKVLDSWMSDHDVVVNPKYSLDQDASSSQADTSLSFAAGSTAKAGLLGPPDPNAQPDPDETKLRADYLASLSGDGVCLD
jgi:hypothetical protein